MDTFLSTLLTMSVTAALVAGIVMLLRLVLRPLPRWITCALWGVVFLRMICPVGLSLPVSLVPQAITSGAYVQHLLPAEPGPAQETVPVQDTPAPAEHTLSAGDGTPPAPAAPADIPRPALLTGVWAAGAGAALLWAAVSYARLRWQVAEAVPVEKGVYESDRVSTPFVCGLLRPRIYLPASLPAEDRHYVLLHERAHLHRRDHWTKPLAYLALCLHWFNPLLWLAYRLFCRDVEAACDQAVIRPLGREDTARYAATLLHLGCRSGFPAAVPLAFGTEDTKGRIRAVLSYRRPALWLILATALRPVFSCWGTPTADWRAGPLTRGWFSPMGRLSPSQSPCWRSCWLSATDMTEIWSPCLPSPLKRTPESFSRARKTTGKFFAGTTLSWSIRLPPAEKTGNPNRTV